MKNKPELDMFKFSTYKLFGISEELYRPGEHTPGMHYHKHYEILYMVSGTRKLIMNDKSYIIDQNSIMLIPPYSFHRSIYTDKNSKTDKKIWINFKPDFILDFIQHLDFRIFDCFSASSPVLYMSEETAGHVYSIMSDMFNSYKLDETLDSQLQLIRLLNILHKNRPDRKKQFDSKIQEIVEYVALHYNEDISLTTLEEKFNVSKYQISRLFPKYAGMSMIKYLAQVRITKAKELLKNGNYKITYVATKVGFENVTYFSKLFKSIEGCSPKEYIQRYKDGTA